jgi:hypothetical protein
MKRKMIGICVCTLLLLALAVPVFANDDDFNILIKNIPNNTLSMQRTRADESHMMGLQSLDIAVTEINANNVQIFLGDGAGAFTFYGNASTGQYPLAITGGDLNSDGHFDVVTSNYNSDTITSLLGDGTGGFAAIGEFSVGLNPFSVTLADFNNDDKLDVAVVNMNEDTISVLFGDGTGGFGTEQTYTVGLYPSDLTAGDFNNDHNIDIIVMNTNDYRLTVLAGDGIGGFSLLNTIWLPSEYSSFCMTQSDFNNDGNLDLAIASATDPLMGILLGDGTGFFSPVSDYTIGPGGERFDVVSDDFNNDGNQDLAVPNTGDNTISVLFGDGTGGFGPHHTDAVGQYPVGIVSGDFNADTYNDLAVTNAFNGTISVLLGDGAGGFAPQQIYSAGAIPVGIVTAEFDYTPIPDLSCTGSLGWTKVKPGATVNGTFQVGNIGDPESLLSWQVMSWPSWGTWTFTPAAGADLTQGSWITVSVSVVAPGDKKTNFTGNVTIVNTENASDFWVIPVYLHTPLSQGFHNRLFLTRFFEWFPHAFPILRYLVGY